MCDNDDFCCMFFSASIDDHSTAGPRNKITQKAFPTLWVIYILDLEDYMYSKNRNEACQDKRTREQKNPLCEGFFVSFDCKQGQRHVKALVVGDF